MGVSPLAAINFLAQGLGQPAVALDAEMQAIADKITPITGRLINNYRNSGSHTSRMNRAERMMNGTLATAPTRFNQPMPKTGGLAMVSSGEGSATSMFPGENYPEMLNMSIGEVVKGQIKSLLMDVLLLQLALTNSYILKWRLNVLDFLWTRSSHRKTNLKCL